MQLKSRHIFLFGLAILAGATAAQAQTGAAVRRPPNQRQQPMGEVDGSQFHTRFVRLGSQGEGLLYEPVMPVRARATLRWSSHTPARTCSTSLRRSSWPAAAIAC